MMRRLAWTLRVGLVLLSVSCNIYACIYRTRFIATAGIRSAPGIGTVVVEYLNFRDYTEEAQVPTVITWNIRGQDLGAAPVRLTLRDAREPSTVVKSLSMNQASATAFASHSSLDVPLEERDQIFRLLDGNAVVVLELVNGNSLTVPLTVTDHDDWHRPRCG